MCLCRIHIYIYIYIYIHIHIHIMYVHEIYIYIYIHMYVYISYQERELSAFKAGRENTPAFTPCCGTEPFLLAHSLYNRVNNTIIALIIILCLYNRCTLYTLVTKNILIKEVRNFCRQARTAAVTPRDTSWSPRRRPSRPWRQTLFWAALLV